MSSPRFFHLLYEGAVHEIRKGAELALSHGPLRPSKGMVSGMIALVLANFSMLGVLLFQFPDFLSTPKVREYLSFDMMRTVLLTAMVLCGVLALFNIAFGRVRRLSAWALFWLAAAVMGSKVGVSATGNGWLPVAGQLAVVPYLGIDWLIFDLLATTLLFTTIEKLRPLKPEMPVFRRDWQIDFMYFVTGHLLIGVTLFLVYAILYGVSGALADLSPAAQGSLRGWVRQLPFGCALLLLLLITDFGRYWLHRFYHETAIGWRLHSIHHSAEHMDWISGSRTHGVETVLSTVVILAPAFLLGFSQNVINVYVLIAGVQAVFNHTNASVRLGPLRYLIVTPNFHHWHHSRDAEGLDRCYAAHFAFWDHLFGTAVKADKNKIWPDGYGVVGDYVPRGFWAQQLHPIRWSGRWIDAHGVEHRENR
ncbi:sterol desaturase family protein [Variovorax paradoxus]|uniref:Sterol desaturase family protein n=1 Tax=Variovorax paradoxus TaxID=34073 RepID=A0A5Q0MBQ1_VARPD|nr:sterol desaturase family protein [Variovorax paradoxus]QFZ85862.1 sterol desaturase family protein [Variovorax paradoxus]